MQRTFGLQRKMVVVVAYYLFVSIILYLYKKTFIRLKPDRNLTFKFSSRKKGRKGVKRFYSV